MSRRKEVVRRLAGWSAGFLALVLAMVAPAQTITVTNGVQTYGALTNTTVNLSGKCELRVTSSTTPLSGCTINLNSADAFLVLPGIKPSSVVSSYLGQVRVSGAAAVVDSNCRVVEFAMGAIVLPHTPSFQPLQVFSGPHFTGTAMSLSQYSYYKASLGALYANISSFKLKRGYMATFAQTESGTGISKCYVAQDGDLEVSVLPEEFDDSVRFVYVLPWRWTSKKGIAGNIESGLNVQWKYNWNLDQNSTRDLEYVPIRQQRWWPDLNQNWQTRGANHLLGYNEPDNADQANIAVGDAIWSWPDLLGTGLRVGSPATTDGGRSGWLYPFMAQADAANLRVDFVAVHYYWCFNPADPAGAANQMYNFLKATYDQTKRPIWITEWNNGANWTGCGDPTAAQQQAAIAAMIDMLDNTPFVERYSIYNWVEDVRRVKWDDGSLTSAGVTYRDKASPIGYLQGLQSNGTRSFAQLKFDTNTLDSSGYGNNGITAGCPAYTNGHAGQAIVFDGTNTAVTLPPNVAANNAFTFAGWINWRGGGNWQRIFDFGNSTTHYLFLTPSSGSGTLRFAIKNGGGEQIVETTGLPQNSWQHVAVTLSGNTARLYTNGVLAAQNTGMSITPASFAPRVNFLGKSQFIADPMFKGLMDDVLITDYALSAAQIAALQTNTPPQFTNSSFALGSATEGVAFTNTLAGTATDVDPGDTLTYSKTIGPAWLSIASNGTLTGTPTAADGGINYFTVRVTDAAGQNGFALVTVNVVILTGSGVWTANANGNWSETNRWSGNFVASGAGQTADFSTINLTSNLIVTLDASRTIGTLKFGDASGTQTWTITNNGAATLTLNTGNATQPSLVVTNTATLSAPVAGTNGFVKSGPGTLILRGNNSLAGTVNIDTGNTGASEGAVRVAGPGALANAALIQIRNNNSGSSTLQLDGAAGSVTIPADIALSGRNVSVAAIQNLAGTNTLSGDLAVNVGGGNYWIQSDAGQLTFSGTISSAATGTRTFTLLGNGDFSVPGVIANGAASVINLTKSGSGTLTLGGSNTYTGLLTSSAGRVLVNGYVSNIVISAGTLGGSGLINGAVSLPSGTTLAPGSSAGKLTFGSSLFLQTGSTTHLEISNSPFTNDVVKTLGALNYGGTLVVTNIGGPLARGDTFTLFEAPSRSGIFAATNLPALSPGLGWNFDSTNGVLSVIQTVATDPPNLAVSVGGGTLNFNWPADHIGWRLESNAVSLIATAAWFTVPGSDLTNELSVAADPATTNVFFRLVYP